MSRAFAWPLARLGGFRPRHIRLSALRWVVATCALAAATSSVLFIGLLMAAAQVFDDISPQLGQKLGLLAHDPKVVFAGDSRTQEQVDPVLVAKLLGKPLGYAINIGVPGEDPLSILAAVRQHLDQFRDIDLIVNLSPYNINDGIKKQFFFPSTLIARLGVLGQIATFLPSHVDTLVWFIQDAFLGSTQRRGLLPLNAGVASRLGFDPVPGQIAVEHSTSSADPRRYRDFLGSEVGPFERHPYYRDWQPSGVKTPSVRTALCDLRPLVKRLVVVLPPWAPLAPMHESAAWRRRNVEFEDIVAAMASECHFRLLPITKVDALAIEHFSDETHVNEAGAEIYTSYLVEQLGYSRADDAS